MRLGGWVYRKIYKRPLGPWNTTGSVAVISPCELVPFEPLKRTRLTYYSAHQGVLPKEVAPQLRTKFSLLGVKVTESPGASRRANHG